MHELDKEDIQSLTGRELELAVMKAGGWRREDAPVKGWRRGNSFRVLRLKPLTDHGDAASLRQEMSADHNVRMQINYDGTCMVQVIGAPIADQLTAHGRGEGEATARAYVMFMEKVKAREI